MLTTLDAIAATMLPMLPSFFHPATTLPQWIAWLIVCFTVWAHHFVQRKKPDAIVQEEARRRDDVLNMMGAILAYVEQEDAKPEAERKMPEAKRVLDLLWDKTYECPTTTWGIEPNSYEYTRCEALYRRVASAELSTSIDMTRRSRLPGALQTAGKEEMKELVAHESGEKLQDALRREKTVQRTLGRQYSVERAVIDEANQLIRSLRLDQSKNLRQLLSMVVPVVPHIVYSTGIGLVHTALRSKFHQIGLWVMTIEAGVGGDMDGALSMLFNLWVGHMLIKLLELPEYTYERRSKTAFGNAIRNGVLSAMVRQDYEYFDRTSAGVLQDRLNRDADELGENLIGFPKEMLEKVVWVVSNLMQVYLTAPPRFFAVAVTPVLLMVVFQFFTFRHFRKCNERARKIEEEGTSETSEVLRHMKTVRQFASEQRAASNYARRNLARQMIGERVTTLKRALEMMVWVVFDSGICLTIIIGLPYVHAGELTAGQLIDCFCKLNFNVNFCLREILEKIPRMARLLEPLGRICELLQAKPAIEPPSHPAAVTARDATELTALLGACHVGTDEKGVTQLTLASLDNTSSCVASGGGAEALVSIGAQLIFLSSADHRYLTPSDLVASDSLSNAQHAVAPTGLTYPVCAVFSTKLRPTRFRGRIEFRDVHFSYPTDLRRPILRGISYVVEPGEKVALVGPTGCGKSSCMSLLQRLYEPSQGTILIDDRPLSAYDVHHLRSRVVIVDQNTVLFSSSIRDNITYGMDRIVSDAEVIDACTRAKAWAFVSEKPDKLMTKIESGGSNLSGGQKQRLAIARAIIRKPDVILLDEATSALDNKNEAEVQRALDELARQGSALVIAHRLSTIKDADKIVVVDHGRAVEIGTHDELLEKLAPSAHATAFHATISNVCTEQQGSLQPTAAMRAMSGPEPCRDDDEGEESPQPPRVQRCSSAPSRVVAAATETQTCTYRKLWDAATGATEASTFQSVTAKIEKAAAELEELRAKQARMERAKRHLLDEGSGSVTPTMTARRLDVLNELSNVISIEPLKPARARSSPRM